jgi:transglutaminase-like putative cysteine protease
MARFPPIPRRIARVASIGIILAWIVQMGWLVRSVAQGESVTLAADLSAYGTSAQWRGIYYRGDKIGFSVGQTEPTATGYLLREDSRMHLAILGSTVTVRLHTSASVDRAFALQSFAFSLDPGTGPTEIRGAVNGKRLRLTIRNRSGEQVEERILDEPPALSLNLPRQLAARGLRSGLTFSVPVFDPATLRNQEMSVRVEGREIVEVAGRPVPAFKVEGRLSGVVVRSWITDVGEIVREETPMGLLVVRESAERAQMLAVPGKIQTDMLAAAAIVPEGRTRRLDDPRAVARLRVRIEGADSFGGPDVQGAGQTAANGVFETVDARTLRPSALDPSAPQYVEAEPFLEVDDPEIRAEALRVVRDRLDDRAKAEALLRFVHSFVEKRPTVSLPSAREVFRTRVGDCNEHTALYVTMVRSVGIPARIAAGLVSLRGAFYYHAWAEVYLRTGAEGLWLPVDPTLNEFPANATHIRLVRGGLDKQASIVGLVGQARLTILEMDLRPEATPVLVGRNTLDASGLDLPVPRRGPGRGCWSSPRR